jgi:pyridoxal phosphate enzyme (YggS family)
MSHAEKNLAEITARIRAAEQKAGREAGATTLVAVTKTFAPDDIAPVLEAGHRVFGENRVQEAAGKWPALRQRFEGIELHLIGPLQSNKAADAVALFDVIETVDRDKIAAAIAAQSKAQGRQPKLLVQVNTGNEPQKAGIAPHETQAFVRSCREVHGLEISGLMCIPPAGEDPAAHFALLAKLAVDCGLPLVSMGMSGDYEAAVAQGATHVRVGSAIFGGR